MDKQLKNDLLRAETNIDGALKRLNNNESLYLMCLNAFVSDKTIDKLTKAIEEESWDDAFTAAHALKGLAGNLGLIPLYHNTAELVLLMRTGRLKEIAASADKVTRCCNDIKIIITHNNSTI